MSAVPADHEDNGFDRLLLLLSAIKDEMHVLSCDIVALGEMISDPGQRANLTTAIQSFDLISQRAFSQVHLLAGLERELSGGTCDFDKLIDQVPFEMLRKRLTAAMSADFDMLMENGDDDDLYNVDQEDVEWF
jgi:hypothetical protein